MAILNIQTTQTGIAGTLPSIAYINTNDTEATVLTAGYLNAIVAQGFQFSMPCVALISTRTTPSAQPDVGWYEIQHSGSNWSAVPTSSPGSVTLPTIANHIATYTNTSGNLSEDPSTAINGGNLQAGLSGTAGYVASFPTTASKGSLRMVAADNAGNTVTQITNASFGQASVLTVPDPAGATANFVMAPAALVSNNLVKASGTAGLIADAGIAASNVMVLNASNVLTGSGQITLVKANGVEAANAVTASGNAGVITTSALTTVGGGTYAITWTNSKITATSVGTFTIQGGTNSATFDIAFIFAPGAGTATLTIVNNTAATSLNGTILIGYTIL